MHFKPKRYRLDGAYVSARVARSPHDGHSVHIFRLRLAVFRIYSLTQKTHCAKNSTEYFWLFFYCTYSFFVSKCLEQDRMFSVHKWTWVLCSQIHSYEPAADVKCTCASSWSNARRSFSGKVATQPRSHNSSLLPEKVYRLTLCNSIMRSYGTWSELKSAYEWLAALRLKVACAFQSRYPKRAVGPNMRKRRFREGDIVYTYEYINKIGSRPLTT